MFRILLLLFFLTISFSPCYPATDVYVRDGIDTSNMLDITSTGSAKISNGVANGTGYASQTVIYTAGQRVALGASSSVVEIQLASHPFNVGSIFVGGANVSSTNGMAIASGQILTLRVNNLSNWYVTSTAGNPGVVTERVVTLTITE